MLATPSVLPLAAPGARRTRPRKVCGRRSAPPERGSLSTGAGLTPPERLPADQGARLADERYRFVDVRRALALLSAYRAIYDPGNRDARGEEHACFVQEETNSLGTDRAGACPDDKILTSAWPLRPTGLCRAGSRTQCSRSPCRTSDGAVERVTQAWASRGKQLVAVPPLSKRGRARGYSSRARH